MHKIRKRIIESNEGNRYLIRLNLGCESTVGIGNE